MLFAIPLGSLMVADNGFEREINVRIVRENDRIWKKKQS